MEPQERCILLELGPLPLECIWSHVSRLPVQDRRALLSTCKKSMQTFARCLASLGLPMRGVKDTRALPGRSQPLPRSSIGSHQQDVQPPGTATYRAALSILTRLGPDASFRRLVLAFEESRGVLMTPTLQSFMHVASSHFARLTALQMDNVAVRGICSVSWSVF